MFTFLHSLLTFLHRKKLKYPTTKFAGFSVLTVSLFLGLTTQKANAQLDCSSAVPIVIGTTYQGNTTGGNSKVSTYNNDPWWQLTGPEVVHELDWPGGDILIKLSNKSAALDLILVKSCDANDFVYSGGGNSGTSDSYIQIYLDQGSYFIIVDGWQQAKGGYDLFVRQNISVNMNGVNRTFFLVDGTVYEQVGQNQNIIATNVEAIHKYWGYVTNSTSGAGQDQNGLAIKLVGQEKPRIFLNENIDTEYLKQKLFCQQNTLSLYGDLVFDGNEQILTDCDILRCENGYTLAHQQNGQIKLYTPASSNTWLDIRQIITVDSVSYFIRQDDKTVWALTGTADQATMIGINARLLQDNDNQLINIDELGNYKRWDGMSWSDLTPQYINVSPEMTDEGFWCFIQAKPLLESGTNVNINHKKGLTFNSNGDMQMELIPTTGNCERFLWRTSDIGGGKRLLINKSKGLNNPLLMSTNGTPTFDIGQGAEEWSITYADQVRFGTNAFHILGANSTKALSYVNDVQSDIPVFGSPDQTWVFQFNQLAKDYFLPLPTKTNLEMYYTDNPNFNLNNDADAILETYNKFLKAANGVTFFATNTSSDWVIVNYYFIINNMMNAVNSPKPSDPNVNPNLINTLSAMKGRSLVLINKNDLNTVVPNHYFTQGFNSFSVASLRGSSGYNAYRKWILVSEELTCKTGIVNRPLDTAFRRYDHGVHEFGHALQELCNWIAIVDANNMCDAEQGKSSECFCYDMQYWFNSSGNSNTYPGLRANKWWQSPSISSAQRAAFMEKIFNKENTWMPPKDLRYDGYNPSGPTVESTPTGIHRIESSKLQAYPNPSKGYLTLDIPNDIHPHFMVIQNVTGQVIHRQPIQTGPNLIDVHHLEAGIYFIQVNTEQGSVFRRIVIQ